MRKYIILCTAPLSIALAACGTPDKPEAGSASVTPPSQVAVSPADASEQRSAANPADHERTQASAQHQDASQYLCQGDADACKVRGPLVADSEAEAQWLLAHGYPTQAELARLEPMSLVQLKAQAQAGNKPAAVLYGKKTAIEGGRFQEGLGILRQAATAGNLYAYYGLSAVYGAETKNKNLIESAAYLRLAYLLGDAQASAGTVLHGLSAVERVAADERAALLYRTVATYRSASPRPIE
ncbi:hypothetical protein [Xanthomonas cerealis]|uniref:Sel1 repeat family protein n=1 Tax=Xanthomonas cerealis pv. cerealis TaxID=152263 RepID=A0A514EG35_9XANT|nr:hypothetical protein [Xanthomonas translucens]QDI04975.1 hypothetical protein E4A48_15935 [Xanthomonas translucens pv. cerealis]UKE46986.1 hypothetical protein KHA79_18400 [Xanthomonas translucens pv. cerealis]UKE69348.1 hypothetical protein K8O61_18295 [Xanthomonas translucens pv. pistacia]